MFWGFRWPKKGICNGQGPGKSFGSTGKTCLFDASPLPQSIFFLFFLWEKKRCKIRIIVLDCQIFFFLLGDFPKSILTLQVFLESYVSFFKKLKMCLCFTRQIYLLLLEFQTFFYHVVFALTKLIYKVKSLLKYNKIKCLLYSLFKTNQPSISC